MSTRDIKFQKQNRRIPYISRLLRFWYCLYTQVVSALEVIHSDLVIVVVSAVTIRVYRCNRALGSIAYNSADTPRIIRILRNSLYILIDNRNDIALQILYKVVRFAVVDDSADAVLIIVKRDDFVASPYFFQNLRSVGKLKSVEYYPVFLNFYSDTIDI